jgi:hypothetical protein
LNKKIHSQTRQVIYSAVTQAHKIAEKTTEVSVRSVEKIKQEK